VSAHSAPESNRVTPNGPRDEWQPGELTALLAANIPLLDVRSPGEFARGAFDTAVNLPLLDDEERRQVGIRYKEAGSHAAIELGETLVAGEHRDQRIRAWREFARAHPNAALYCWRGGLRSRIVQGWLAATGVSLPRVSGGFKALRHTCLETIERFAKTAEIVVLAGRTGSGKTRLLRAIPGHVDLEAAANHRGSAFGGELDAQPTPIHFENRLAVALLRRAPGCALLEDESRTIGRLALPRSLYDAMQAAPLVLLEASLAERIALILDEYVLAPIASGVPAETLAARYLNACNRIRARLGGERHSILVGELTEAFRTPADPAGHAAWIERVLRSYYDPMYDWQIERKASRIVFRGDAASVAKHLRGAAGISVGA
jgi:tRNA 2-selenouridine synthase